MPRAHVEGPGFFPQSARAFAYSASGHEHSAAGSAQGNHVLVLSSMIVPMYITDLTHFLDEKGAIGPKSGPARRLAEFLGRVVAAASAPGAAAEDDCIGKCRCNKCKGTVIAEIAPDDAIEWFCESCGHEGRISNWRRSFWDLSGSPAKR